MNPARAISTSILAMAAAAVLPAAAATSSIAYSPTLDGIELPGGITLWFNSVLRPAGVPLDSPVTICITQQVITYKQGRDTISIDIPDSRVSFKPWESTASLSYADSQWSVSVPSTGATYESFISGNSRTVPTGFTPGSMTWTAQFASDVAGVSVQWRWGAASYTSFGTSLGALDVVPTDARHEDRAGTPFAYKDFVVGGNDADPDDYGDPRFTGLRSTIKQAAAEVTGSCSAVY